MMFRNLMLAGFLAVSASTAFAVSESEPNDDRGSATDAGLIPTTLTGGLPGSLGNTGNAFYEDFWSFTATGGTQYSFVASPNAGGSPSLDIGLDLQDAIGNLLTGVDNGIGNATETLNWTAPSSGTYYLIVYEATNTLNAIKSYNVNVSSVSAVSDWSMY